jgi:beta-lactamase class A
MNLKKFIHIILIFSIFLLTSIVVKYLYSAYENKKNEEKIRLQRKITYEQLYEDIMPIIKKFNGEVGIFIKDLKTGVEIKYNENKPFPSASLVKLPLMVAVFYAVNDGNITFDTKLKLLKKYKCPGSGILKRYTSGKSFTLRQLIELMITESDNTATNMITEQLGLNYIDWLFKNKLGLKITNFSRNIMDLKKRSMGIENYTTASEMVHLLEKIYNGEIISKETSNEMLTILKKQKINDRIPRYLPTNLTIAHKTGLMHDTCHDTGIIFTPKGDFIICILTAEIKNITIAKKFIGNIASKTYQYYN